MSDKAPETELSELHGMMARAMKLKLESGDASASDLNVIRQFLKDNGINSDGPKNPDLRKLSDDLPDEIDMGNVHPMYGR